MRSCRSRSATANRSPSGDRHRNLVHGRPASPRSSAGRRESRDALKKYAERIWHIPVDHFDPGAASRAALRREPIPLAQVLVSGSTYSRRSLKERLYAEGIKARRCELCGQGEEWRGRRMSLILDHINGDAIDNRLENLRIVCPNCAATLETHCGRNLVRLFVCDACGCTFTRRTAQRHCSRECGQRSPLARDAQLALRRVERPPYEQLLAEIAATSWSAVGRRYGVSDNAVRKWVRAYEREQGDAPRAAGEERAA